MIPAEPGRAPCFSGWLESATLQLRSGSSPKPYARKMLRSRCSVKRVFRANSDRGGSGVEPDGRGIDGPSRGAEHHLSISVLSIPSRHHHALLLLPVALPSASLLTGPTNP